MNISIKAVLHHLLKVYWIPEKRWDMLAILMPLCIKTSTSIVFIHTLSKISFLQSDFLNPPNIYIINFCKKNNPY